jgi:hypothetical protein
MLSTSTNLETVIPVKLKDGTVIPEGSTISVQWSEFPAGVNLVTWNGRELKLSGRSIGKALAGELPTNDDMEDWVCDSICDTPTGHSVEPDGWGPDGVPSWLMLAGVI